MITLEEEIHLVEYYAVKLIEVGKALKAPSKVICTACTYLKRFYIGKTSWEYDPQFLVLACLYLASKVEDCYMAADELSTHVGMPTGAILKLELPLLQGLHFDLQVFHVHKALEGIMSSFTIEESVLKDVRAKANSVIDEFLSSDAILLFTPGQIALKALLVADPAIEADPQYQKLVLGQHDDTDDSVAGEKMASCLDSLQEYIGKQKEGVNVAAIDRKLKLFSSHLQSFTKSSRNGN
jgi:cyclin H